ncbi:hypothetical protein [Azospirillum sp.]|uniref:hypothetical protein n=1 Tax=Azospirillum sp. TaxID=34012 RepID=UPI003D73F7A0
MSKDHRIGGDSNANGSNEETKEPINIFAASGERPSSHNTDNNADEEEDTKPVMDATQGSSSGEEPPYVNNDHTAKNPAVYEAVELDDDNHPEMLIFRREKNGSTEPQRMKDLRKAISSVSRVIKIFMADDPVEKKKMFYRLHLTADTGCRGPNYNIDDGWSNLEEIQQRLTDYGIKVRSTWFQRYSKTALRVFIPFFIAGGLVYEMSINAWLLPAPHNGVFIPPITLAVALCWIIAGSAFGVWLEFVLRVQTITFEQLLYFDPGRWSPNERFCLASGVALAFGFFLALPAVQIGIGPLLLNQFADSKPIYSIAVGVITGFSFPYVRDILYNIRPVEKPKP